MGNGRFAAMLAVLISLGVAAWPSVTQKSVAQGVTVAVTPMVVPVMIVSRPHRPSLAERVGGTSRQKTGGSGERAAR